MRYLILILLFVPSISFATYGTFLNSSHILQRGEYNASVGSQFFSSPRRGTLVTANFDLPVARTTNLRLYGGAGSFDFSLGSHIKWVPFSEETSKLPFNLGANLMTDYGRDDGLDAFLLRAAPFITKAFSWEFGEFEPYISVPMGTSIVDDSSHFTAQFIIGSRFHFENLNYMSFYVEGGFDIEEAYDYFALMATIYLQ